MFNNAVLRFLRIFVLRYFVPYGNMDQMAEVLLKDRLKQWRGKRSLKEAAAALGVDYPTYRKYETGKRNPCKLAAQQLDRMLLERMP